MMMHCSQTGIHKPHAVGKVTGLMAQSLRVAGQPSGNCVAGWRFNLIERRLVASRSPCCSSARIAGRCLQQATGIAADQVMTGAVRGVRDVAGCMDLCPYVLVWKKRKRRGGEKLVPVSMRKGKGKVCDFDFDRLRIRLFRPTQRTKGVAQGACHWGQGTRDTCWPGIKFNLA